MKMRKWGLGCLGTLLLILIIGFVVVKVISEPKPELERQEEANLLAGQVLIKLNKVAWDTLGYISWSFRDEHHYAWNKTTEHAIVSWDNNSVLMNLKNIDQFATTVDGELVEGDTAKALRDSAWSFWCNDSFWLSAPYKLFDPGTQRGIVTLDDGSEALLINYTSGGVTPGDAYLWILDSTKQPKAYKMWTSIIPIGGLEVSWEDWKTLDGGARIAQKHMLSSVNIAITNLKSGQTPQAVDKSIADFRL